MFHPRLLERFAFCPSYEDQAALEHLVASALSRGGEPWAWPERHGLRRRGDYAGFWFADPAASWIQPPDLGDMDVDSWQPSTLEGTPRGLARQFLVVGGDLVASIRHRPGTATLYRDTGCEIERLLVAGSITAGEATGIARAGAARARWLPRELRRALVEAADREARNSPHVV